MIDDPWKTDLLISMLKESLPLEANITHYLTGALMEKSPDMAVPKKCSVTSVFYTGDMGRILCGLDMGGTETNYAHVVSITHLAFDRRAPVSREIDAYQRHRIKKLKNSRVAATDGDLGSLVVVNDLTGGSRSRFDPC